MSRHDPMRWWEWLLLATLIATGIGISCAYHACANGNWKCGLPGVECRKL